MKKTYYNKPKRLEKLSREKQLSLLFDLVNVFSHTKGSIKTTLLLQDLLTAKEIKNIARRLRIAKLLLSGKTHEEIVQSIHCSFATITKISVWLSRGRGSLKNAISKLPERYAFPKIQPRGPIEFHLPQTLLTIAKHNLAKHQTERLENFLKNIESKKTLDKNLQKAFDEYFRGKNKKNIISS
jgi:uncharacterized protein YerC